MPHSPNIVLLEATEHLIAAHKSAKLYGDGTVIGLIEDAMVHAGRMLAEMSGSSVGPDVLAALGRDRGSGPC